MLKYWVESYDGFTVIFNINTEADDTRGVDTIYSPQADQESIDKQLDLLDYMGFEKQESRGVEDYVKEHIDTRLK